MIQKEPARDPEGRRAVNFLLEGTVGDLIKLVEVRMDEFFRENGMDSRVILNIHDGLCLSVPLAEYPVLKMTWRETMDSADLVERIRTSANVSAIFPIHLPLKAKITILKRPA